MVSERKPTRMPSDSRWRYKSAVGRGFRVRGTTMRLSGANAQGTIVPFIECAGENQGARGCVQCRKMRKCGNRYPETTGSRETMLTDSTALSVNMTCCPERLSWHIGQFALSWWKLFSSSSKTTGPASMSSWHLTKRSQWHARSPANWQSCNNGSDHASK